MKRPAAAILIALLVLTTGPTMAEQASTYLARGQEWARRGELGKARRAFSQARALAEADGSSRLFAVIGIQFFLADGGSDEGAAQGLLSLKRAHQLASEHKATALAATEPQVRAEHLHQAQVKIMEIILLEEDIVSAASGLSQTRKQQVQDEIEAIWRTHLSLVAENDRQKANGNDVKGAVKGLGTLYWPSSVSSPSGGETRFELFVNLRENTFSCSLSGLGYNPITNQTFRYQGQGKGRFQGTLAKGTLSGTFTSTDSSFPSGTLTGEVSGGRYSLNFESPSADLPGAAEGKLE